jgi:hypothetical protein
MGKMRNMPTCEILDGKSEGTEHLGLLGVVRRTILKWILKKKV